jgi:hypothetical protein
LLCEAAQDFPAGTFRLQERPKVLQQLPTPPTSPLRLRALEASSPTSKFELSESPNDHVFFLCSQSTVETEPSENWSAMQGQVLKDAPHVNVRAYPRSLIKPVEVCQIVTIYIVLLIALLGPQELEDIISCGSVRAPKGNERPAFS